ncbi:MAG: PIN domain-containing protein [Anaerolineae bacterium]|nr:PIN domain-containing protein [Anaerolineae bacterium]
MIRAVADTHAMLWYLYDDPRLSQAARDLMDAVDAAGDQIAISSVTLAELVYLVEKGRIASEAWQRVMAIVQQPNAALVEIPLDREVVNLMWRVERQQVPDLPDRIVAATGLLLGVPVISRDRRIQWSGVTTVW